MSSTQEISFFSPLLVRYICHRKEPSPLDNHRQTTVPVHIHNYRPSHSVYHRLLHYIHIRYHMPIDVKKAVSKDEFDAHVAALKNSVTCVATPVEDVQILANLLGVSPETLGETFVGFPDGGGVCGQCSRVFSFLDIAATGLDTAHSKQFLVDVLSGKHGYIINTGDHSFNCNNCGTDADCGVYITGNYAYGR
ncbi:hypothetical protein C8J56DRAFT_961263 [Mycena floridula]|nr:hypothetical protein C8J56DRAFT_961263 [Mycena floridula]